MATISLKSWSVPLVDDFPVSSLLLTSSEPWTSLWLSGEINKMIVCGRIKEGQTLLAVVSRG